MKYPDKYAIYDLETTGLDPREDEAVEIGAMMVVDGKVAAARTWILKPSVPIPKEASDIHGITPEMVGELGADRHECWEEFVDFVGLNAMHSPWPIVGHNIVRFDNLFLARALAQIGFTLDGADFIDTAAIYKGRKLGIFMDEASETHEAYARRVLETKAFGLKYRLADVYQELGGSMAGIVAHRASGDVRMTNHVYRTLAGLEIEPSVEKAGSFPTV